MLAGLVQSPSRLAPNHNPDGAVRRAALVIADMAELKMISDSAAKLALAHPARAIKPAGAGTVNYVADWVMDAVNDIVGNIDQDIVVETTIDPALQSAAEQALVDTLTQKGDKLNIGEGALVAMTPDGVVRALVGGRNYGESQFNRAIDAKRQPGSAFKPFVYLTALEHGLTPDTVREDAPIAVKGWKPENFEHQYWGPVTLTQALANSLNTVSVRLTLEFGPDAVIRTAYRLGITSQLEPNASIALGTSEVSPFELVSAYATFANGGLRDLAACRRAHPHRGRQDALRALGAAARPHRRRALRRHDEHDDAADAGLRHRARGEPARLAGRRQDRHQPGLPRRLVHRLHLASRHRRLARQRRQFADQAGGRRRPAGRNLEPLHESRACRHRAGAAAGIDATAPGSIRRRPLLLRPGAPTNGGQQNNQQNSGGGLDFWLLDKLFGRR